MTKALAWNAKESKRITNLQRSFIHFHCNKYKSPSSGVEYSFLYSGKGSLYFTVCENFWKKINLVFFRCYVQGKMPIDSLVIEDFGYFSSKVN
jgi:hypothetical protein